MTEPGGPRPLLAVYWTSGCGGCEAAFLDLGERLQDLDNEFELVLFPLLIDRKLEDLEGLADGAIDVSLLTGAIRSVEDVRMAQLLRRTSKTLIAFGACAQLGSVLSLANLVPVETLLRTVLGEASAARLLETHVGGGNDAAAPELSRLTASVQPVEGVVPVDFSVPGCPPEVERLREVLAMLAGELGGGRQAQELGPVLGCAEATVCEDCARQRPDEKVARFFRLHEVDPDPARCLLDQGLVCSGPATRGGCGAPCPAAGAPCRGCYGHPAGIEDQGARMLGALAAMIELDAQEIEPERLRRRAEEVLGSIVDPVGTLYRYCFARSLLARLREPRGERA